MIIAHNNPYLAYTGPLCGLDFNPSYISSSPFYATRFLLIGCLYKQMYQEDPSLYRHTSRRVVMYPEKRTNDCQTKLLEHSES